VQSTKNFQQSDKIGHDLESHYNNGIFSPSELNQPRRSIFRTAQLVQQTFSKTKRVCKTTPFPAAVI